MVNQILDILRFEMDSIFSRSENFSNFVLQPTLALKLPFAYPQEKVRTPRRKEHSTFLYVYFNFAYFLLISPFRFRRVGKGEYEFCRWLPKKLLCGLASATSIVAMGTNVRSSLSEVKRDDPVSFFVFFQVLFYFIFMVKVVMGFWTKRELYLKLINFSRQNPCLDYAPGQTKNIFISHLILIFYTLVCFSNFFLKTGFLPDGRWSPELWARLQLDHARHLFFLIGEPDLTNFSWTGLDAVFTGASSFSTLSLELRAYFGELLLLVHVWKLWAPTFAFASFLRKDMLEKVDEEEGKAKLGLGEILEQFDALKRLSTLIDRTAGYTFLLYVGQASFYYAVYFDGLILADSEVLRLDLVSSYVLYLSILLFSAEIVRKMRCFKAWLFERGRWRLIEQRKLTVILDELASHRVGITASGIFTFNYSFVGTVISLLITYFIIRLKSMSVFVPKV